MSSMSRLLSRENKKKHLDGGVTSGSLLPDDANRPRSSDYAPKLDIQLPTGELSFWDTTLTGMSGAETSDLILEEGNTLSQSQSQAQPQQHHVSFIGIPSSVDSSTGNALRTSQEIKSLGHRYAKVKTDYAAKGPEELSVEEDDIVRILENPSSLSNSTSIGGKDKRDCVFVTLNGNVGWIPVSIVHVLTTEEFLVETSGEFGSVDGFDRVLFQKQASGLSTEDNSPTYAEDGSLRRLSRPGSQISIETAGTAATADDASGLAPQTKSWYNKYRAIPRYEKKSISNSRYDMEKSNSSIALAVPGGSNEEMPMSPGRPPSSISESSPVTPVPSTPSEKTKTSFWTSVAASTKGSVRTTNTVAIVGAPAGQRALWVETVGGQEAVDKLNITKKEVKRQEVIHEILCTEQDYIDDLDIVCEVYIKSLKKNKIIRPKDMAIIFSNIEQLVPVNLELLKSLEKRRQANPVVELIGDIFIRVSDYLKMYTMYCSNHPYALMKLQSIRQNKTVAKFLDQCAHLPECRNLNLSNFLLKPVQRVCKYPLLLREVVKNTEQTHPDYEQLVKALLKIETVVTIINEGARQTENVHKMLDLQAKFPQKVNIVAPSRVFVTGGTVLMRNSHDEKKKRELFVFTDMLIIAKQDGPEKLKLLHMIPFDMIFVNNVADDPAKGEYAIELVHVGQAKLYVWCDSLASKEQWLASLRSTVEEWLSQKTRLNNASARPVGTTVQITPGVAYSQGQSTGLDESFNGSIQVKRQSMESNTISSQNGSISSLREFNDDKAPLALSPLSPASPPTLPPKPKANTSAVDVNAKIKHVSMDPPTRQPPPPPLKPSPASTSTHDLNRGSAEHLTASKETISSEKHVRLHDSNHTPDEDVDADADSLVEDDERASAPSQQHTKVLSQPGPKRPAPPPPIPQPRKHSSPSLLGSSSGLSENHVRESQPQLSRDDVNSSTTSLKKKGAPPPIPPKPIGVQPTHQKSGSDLNKPMAASASDLIIQTKVIDNYSINQGLSTDQPWSPSHARSATTSSPSQQVKGPGFSLHVQDESRGSKESFAGRNSGGVDDSNIHRRQVTDGPVTRSVTQSARVYAHVSNDLSAVVEKKVNDKSIQEQPLEEEEGSSSTKTVEITTPSKSHISTAQQKAGRPASGSISHANSKSSIIIAGTNLPRAGTNVNRPVREAKILDLVRGAGSNSKSFVYLLRVSYVGAGTSNNGSSGDDSQQYTILKRTYDHFFDLHLQLVGHFPDAAGITTSVELLHDSNSTSPGKKQDRILPELPPQMMFVSEASARARIGQLQSYVDSLLSLPYKISRSPVVLKFFNSSS